MNPSIDQDVIEEPDHLESKLLLSEVVAGLVDDAVDAGGGGHATEHEFAWISVRFEDLSSKID